MGLRGPDGVLFACLRRLDERGVGPVSPLVGAPAPVDGDQASCPHFDGTWLWQPTRTAVHRVDPDTLSGEQVLTHPLFHDVHSIAPGRQGWYVTCTGHETVVDIGLDGRIYERFSLGPSIDPDRDYRYEPHDARKPHAVHPNRAFLLDDAGWVTCLSEGVCRGLGHDGRWDLGPGMPHDGILRQGLVWFTTTAGRVIAVDPARGERVVELDVATLESARGAFGWCRGIEVIDDRLWVGITVLRSAAWREAARGVLRGARGRREPTRVLEIDWRRSRITGRWEVGRGGEGVIYGVSAVQGSLR